ncbi:MAG: LysE family transporter [Azospirillaceae bacterium]
MTGPARPRSREDAFLSNIVFLWLAALPLLGSPGPATMGIAGMGAAYGARRGLVFTAGVCCGTTTVLVLVASGVTAALLAVPGLREVIIVAAIAYMIYLAYRIASAPPLGSRPHGARAPSFPGGYFLAIANPKAYAVLGALFSSHLLVAGDPLGDAALKVAALVVVIAVVNTIWLCLGALVAKALSDPRRGRIANLLFAAALLLSVALALI